MFNEWKFVIFNRQQIFLEFPKVELANLIDIWNGDT